MKALFFIAALFAFSTLQAQNNLEKEISLFLDNWHNAAAKADLDAYFGAIANDGIFIGTDSSEHWNKAEFLEYCKPYFDKGKAWTFKANSRHIYISEDGTYAWFDELLFTGSTTWRGSGIIELNENGFKIKHYTLSVTLPNDKMKEFFKLLKKEKNGAIK